MAFDAVANFGYSTVAVAPSPSTSGTSLTLHVGDGARMPAPPFNAVVWPPNVLPLSGNAEIVRVTGVTGDTLTIARAQEGTTARAITTGYQVSAAITAKTLTDTQAAITQETARAQAAEAANATAISTETTRATAAEAAVQAASLQKGSNLSDLASATTARTNLGLGTAATHAATDFDTAGSAASETARAQAAEALALQKASNLSDVGDAPTARTNLGLGSAATQASSAFDSAGAAATAQAASLQKATNLGDLSGVGQARANLNLDRLAQLRGIFRTAPVAAVEAPATGVIRCYRTLGGTTDLWEAEELAQLTGLPGGFLVNQAWRRFSCFPVRAVADSDSSVVKSGTWTNGVAQAAAPFGSYSYCTGTGDTATISETGKRLAVGIVTASNGGVWAVSIDGDGTAAALRSTAQDLVNSGALPSSVLVANGGTLQPTQRVIDCYSATTSYNVLLGLAEYATSSTHTVVLRNTGYQNVAAGANRCYLSAAGAQDPTTSILGSGVMMAIHRFFLSTIQSAKEFAVESSAAGQPAYQFTGNVHGCEVQSSLTVTVDGQTIAPTVLGGLTAGQSVEVCRVSQIKQPGGTGVQANGSNVLTGCTWVGAFNIGDTIYGYGIPSSTTVTAVNAGAGTITMSNNGTLNATTSLVTNKNLWAATVVYRYGAEGIETRVTLDASAMTSSVSVDKAYAGMDPLDSTFAKAEIVGPISTLGTLAASASAGASQITLTTPLSSAIIAGQHLLLDAPGLQEEVVVQSVNTSTGVVTLVSPLATRHASGTVAYRTTFRMSQSDVFFGQVAGDGTLAWASSGLASLMIVPDPERSVAGWSSSAPLNVAIQDRSGSPALTKGYITAINTGVPAWTVGPGGQTLFRFSSLRAGALLANPDQVLPR